MFGKSNIEQNLLQKRVSDCSLFSELSAGEIKSLLSIAHIRDYAENEKIFDEGTIGLCFYIIVRGSVKLIYEKDGRIIIASEFKEGEHFSEANLFSEDHHTVSCAASEVTKLIVFAKPDIEDLVRVKPKLGIKILLRFLDYFGKKMDELYKENRELRHKLHP
jgi:CRP-like cAMP-binding protein